MKTVDDIVECLANHFNVKRTDYRCDNEYYNFTDVSIEEGIFIRITEYPGMRRPNCEVTEENDT